MSATEKVKEGLGIRVPGAASSAAKMNCRSGSVERAQSWLYVPREGWVRWVEIESQVAKAHEQWRIKKALQGVQIVDGWEWRHAQIEEAVAGRRDRALWAGARCLGLCRRQARDEEAAHVALSRDEMAKLGVWAESSEEAA